MPAPRTIDAVVPFRLNPSPGSAIGFEAATSCDRATPARFTLDELQGIRDWINEVLEAAKTPEPPHSRVVPQPPMTERDWWQANLDEDAARTATESW